MLIYSLRTAYLKTQRNHHQLITKEIQTQLVETSLSSLSETCEKLTKITEELADAKEKYNHQIDELTKIFVH